MTTNQALKRRIRSRMAKTGERYTAARKVLLDQLASARTDAGQTAEQRWAALPETSNAAVQDATGRGWNEWVDLIEAWPGDRDDHRAVAAHVATMPGVNDWWAQAITVGFERITGRRLPYQRPDGTFTASKSKTVPIAHDTLRAWLVDDHDRAALFPGRVAVLVSRPSAKAIRIDVADGVATIGLIPTPDGRTRVAVQHAGLGAFDDVAVSKLFWQHWLDALG